MKKRVRNRWLLNLVLLISAIILMSILLLGKEPAPTKTLLVSFFPDPIHHIQLIRPNKTTIKFHKPGKRWLMTEPYAVPADETQIQSLLSLLQSEVNAKIDPNLSEPEKFGLQSPEITIQFNNKRIVFGDTQPVGKQRYIRIGKKIMLINERLRGQLSTSSVSMINRLLVPTDKEIDNILIGGQDFKTSDVDTKSTQTIRQWKSIKANWISLAANDNMQGIPVLITYKQGGTLNYVAQRRDIDLVLIRKDLGLEYHLPLTVIEALGLLFTDPAPESSPATARE